MKRIPTYGPKLSAGLKSYIRSRKAELGPTEAWGADLLERLERFAISGKLLRGCVLCYSYEAFSGRAPDDGVIGTAIALELTHSGLLIHDDIMDGDALRRGRPSMHEQYRSAAEREGLADAAQFGTSMAMSGGDAALFMALDLLAEAQASHPRPEPYKMFTGQLLKTCAGQMQDIYLESRADMPSRQTIYGLMRNKTAAYTLALPLAMGAELAGQPRSVIRRLQAIGMAGGTIFQIRDDELGVFGDTGKTGKPVGADIKEGKKTLLHYYLFKHCSAAERQRINSVFGNPDATEKDIAYVRRLARSRGVSKLLAQEIARLRAKAYADIARLPLDATSKQELRSLVAFCALRQL